MFIYLDNNATTPVASGVAAAMAPFHTEFFGNPASLHRFGQELRPVIARAREAVAALLSAEPAEITFTSGATEAINTALFGLATAHPGKRHLVATGVEHDATLKTCEALGRRGFDVTILPVDETGGLDLRQFEQALRPDTLAASVMWANNETGVIFPIAELAAIARSRGVLFHCDAVQAAGKIPFEGVRSGVDLMSVSSHKFHGPKGMGALYVRRGVRIAPLIHGGGQEEGMRSGTSNVPGIAGMGKAAELALEFVRSGGPDRMAALRDRLERGLLDRVEDARVNGAGQPRIPNTTNLAFRHASGEAMLQLLDEEGIAAATSSACQSNDPEPSHVLKAMDVPVTWVRGSLRLSLSRYTSNEEVDAVLAALPDIVAKSRRASTFSGDPLAGEFERFQRQGR
ncbi:MAG: Cysteine desulfurase NifS [Myxococcota bacterium]|nr:Cysteine desulfurase NifS [Myxococcota bacterium]